MDIKHHWACEESSMMKAEDMIKRDYFGHAGGLTYPHLISKAECAAGQWVEGSVTKDAGIALANRLYNQWKNSPDHRGIMLAPVDSSVSENDAFAIDGFAFYAKESNYSESFGGKYPKRTANKVYMIKAVYHRSDSRSLWDTSDTTNPASPGYQPKSN